MLFQQFMLAHNFHFGHDSSMSTGLRGGTSQQTYTLERMNEESGANMTVCGIQRIGKALETVAPLLQKFDCDNGVTHLFLVPIMKLILTKI